jgi:hypothetical protein
MSMIEAHVVIKAITDCIVTEKATHIMLARACCRHERPSATKDNIRDGILSAAETSQIEKPQIVISPSALAPEPASPKY